MEAIMKRSDGNLLKSLKPFVKIIPYIMDKRSDAQNFSKQVLCADSIDRYIAEKKEQGFRLNYMHQDTNMHRYNPVTIHG